MKEGSRLLGFYKQEMGCPEDKTVSQASEGLEVEAGKASVGPEGRSSHK